MHASLERVKGSSFVKFHTLKFDPHWDESSFGLFSTFFHESTYEEAGKIALEPLIAVL